MDQVTKAFANVSTRLVGRVRAKRAVTSTWSVHRRIRWLALCMLFAGCGIGYRVPERVPETPMPQNTILISEVMRILSRRSGSTEAFLAQLRQTEGKQGSALLTPQLATLLRELVLGQNWQGLDRFAGWDTEKLDRSVAILLYYAGPSDSKLRRIPSERTKRDDSVGVEPFLDIGPYGLRKAVTINLDWPSTFPPFSVTNRFTTITTGLVHGAGPNELASEHAESVRLALVLNRPG